MFKFNTERWSTSSGRWFRWRWVYRRGRATPLCLGWWRYPCRIRVQQGFGKSY